MEVGSGESGSGDIQDYYTFKDINFTMKNTNETSEQSTTIENGDVFKDNKFNGNLDHFEAFIKKYAPNLKSLQFIRCNIKMQDFMKLMASCNNLVELTLDQCEPSSLFLAGLDIIDYYQYFAGCRRNLAKLKSFTFIDIDKGLYNLTKEGGMDLILSETTNLQVLKYLLYGQPFPSLKFAKILTSNHHSLTTLELNQFKLDKDLLEQISKIQFPLLTIFSLKNGEISHAEYFSGFLSNQVNLLQLQMVKVCLDSNCFEDIEKLQQLDLILLEDCKIEESSLVLLPLNEIQYKNNTQLTFVGNNEIYPGVLDFFKYSNAISSLTRLTYQLTCDKKASTCFEYIGSKLPNLKYLNIANVFIKNGTLHHLWKLTNLEELDMNSTKLTVSDFNEVEENGVTLGLKNLQKLKTLILSGTMTSDEVILKHVVKLPILEHIGLESTFITFKSLRKIHQKVNCLKHLDIRNCIYCKFTAKQMDGHLFGICPEFESKDFFLYDEVNDENEAVNNQEFLAWIEELTKSQLDLVNFVDFDIDEDRLDGDDDDGLGGSDNDGWEDIQDFEVPDDMYK